jgi:hypothetical protein
MSRVFAFSPRCSEVNTANLGMPPMERRSLTLVVLPVAGEAEMGNVRKKNRAREFRGDMSGPELCKGLRLSYSLAKRRLNWRIRFRPIERARSSRIRSSNGTHFRLPKSLFF